MPPMTLHPIRALRDNYVWLLADDAGDALVVDPGESAPVLAELQRRGLRLRAILLTHHHADHIGGVADLVGDGDVEVFAPHDPRIGQASRRIGDGDRITVAHPPSTFTVIGVPGHTSSHVAYHGHDLLFSGDTLFSVGCGRMFEGTPTQMLASLDRLAALPGDTRVCCGHEYTVANCAFAQFVDPGNPALRDRTEQARGLAAAGTPTVPSTMASERACNPFLRVDDAVIIARFRTNSTGDAARAERFAALRALKDDFRG